MGGLSSTLRFVPFLPFARTLELGESIVGGAYLSSSDLWALGLARPVLSVWLAGFLYGISTQKGRRQWFAFCKMPLSSRV